MWGKIRTVTRPLTGLNRYHLGMTESITEADIYRLIGPDGFARLTAGFYRQIPTDDILGPMYPAEDLQGAQERLQEFLIQRFGGPADYSAKRGHPRLRMRHAPFPIDQKARDRWMLLMTNSLKECGFGDAVDSLLLRYFEQTATFMMNRAE
jgi:hemoglobin